MSKEPREKLHQCEENGKMAAILACVGDGIISTDFFGIVNYMNFSAEDLTGWKQQEALGKHLSDIFPIVDAFTGESFGQLTSMVVESKGTIGLKNNSVLICKNGQRRFVSASCSPISSEDGDFSGIVLAFRDITRIKTLEIEHRNEQNNLKLIFNSASVGMLIIDAGNIINIVNDAALDILDKKRADVIGKRFGDSYSCKGSTENELGCGYGASCIYCDLKTSIEYVLNTGKSISNMEWNRTFFHDGREIELWFRASFIPMLIEDKKNVVVTLMDITSRKQIELSAIKLKDSWMKMLEGFPTPIWRADIEKRCDYVNKTYEQFTGVKREAAMGFGWNDSVHPDDAENCLRAFSETFDKREIFKMEYRKLNSKGEYRWVVGVATPYYNLEEGFAGYIGTLYDITDNKNAEALIRENQAKYHSLFMNMPSGFTYHKIIRDKNGKPIDFEYLEVNEAFEKMSKMSKQDIIGKRFSELFPNFLSSYEEKISLFGEVAATGESKIINEFFSEIFGVWYSLSIFSHEKEYFVKIYTDITEHKKAEKEIKKAIQDAEAASKAKSEFLANMSHEIRTPLNGMLGMIDLTMFTDLTAEQKENLSTAKQCADSLLNIINDILDFSKMEAGKLSFQKTNFNIRDLVEETIRIHSIKAMDKGLELNYQLAASIPQYLFGDPLRLQQVINNLISNAIKFTERGEVLLRVKKRSIAGERLELLFSVSDTGVGINEKDVDKLFKSFSQLDSTITRKHGGTGLGLVISKQLVEMMGGSIWVESEKDKGSIFYFTANLDIGQAMPEKRVAAAIKQNIDTNYLKLLLAEDDTINQRVLMKLLRERGYIVELASNGQEAVAMYIGKKYDAILMDVQMPDVDGIEATRMIREIEQQYNIHTPIIAMTAFALQGDKERFLNLGMDDYLAKPIKIEELYGKLDSIASIGARPSLTKGVTLNNNGELMFVEKDVLILDDKVEIVVKQISEAITELELTVDIKDVAMIEKLAHRIKELADSIDAYELKSSAFRVELAVRRGDIEGTLLCTMQLRHEFETIKKSTNK